MTTCLRACSVDDHNTWESGEYPQLHFTFCGAWKKGEFSMTSLFNAHGDIPSYHYIMCLTNH